MSHISCMLKARLRTRGTPYQISGSCPQYPLGIFKTDFNTFKNTFQTWMRHLDSMFIHVYEQVHKPNCHLYSNKTGVSGFISHSHIFADICYVLSSTHKKKWGHTRKRHRIQIPIRQARPQLTLKAPPIFCSRRQYKILPLFQKKTNKTILVKYHTLFFRKLGKMSQNLSSAAVVIGALRVKVKSPTLSLSLSLSKMILKLVILHKQNVYPAGTWRQTTTYQRRCDAVASTLIRRCFKIMCLLGMCSFSGQARHTVKWATFSLWKK